MLKKAIIDYRYARPHAVTSTGDRTYQYDASGNMTGWASGSNLASWMNFEWDEENRLKRSVTLGGSTDYRYDYSGARIIKKGTYGEVVYVNDNYSIRNGDVESKHIFAGNTRIATKMSMSGLSESVYYYHGDHLGSSSVVSRKDGTYHEDIEYFPYGETWVHNKATSESESMPYKFTSKEQDPETGLYYFGARYYEPKVSRWISTDPAIDKYLPQPGKGDDGLPGLGGVFNPVNMNLYSYAGNNPIVIIDPDGRTLYNIVISGDSNPFQHTLILHVSDFSGEMTFYDLTGPDKGNAYLWVRKFDYQYGAAQSFKDYYGGRVPAIMNKNFDPTKSINDNYDVAEVMGVNEEKVLNFLNTEYKKYGAGESNITYYYGIASDNCAGFDYKAFKHGGIEFTPEHWYEKPDVFPRDLNQAIRYHNEIWKSINNYEMYNYSILDYIYGGSSGGGGGGGPIYFGGTGYF